MVDLAASDVLLEFRQVGNLVRVAAIDPATNTEITITGPASAGRQALAHLAVQRLNYVLGRKAAGKVPQRA